MQKALAGFWSYVHADDAYERGKIATLRERLQQSVRFHTGSAFEVFLDKKDIGWGQQWEDRIRNSLNDALLLFPVITPSYFASKACRDEFHAFRERQEKLGRDDLVLPIYYVSADLLEGAEDESEPDQKEVVQYFRDHQYEDFRSLRTSEETDPSYSQAVERLGRRVAEALRRSRVLTTNQGSSKSDAVASKSKVDDEESLPTMSIQGPENSAPGHITEFSVNQMPGRGNFTNIADAIARAPGGARLIISAGHYREKIVIDKPLELIGSGSTEDIVIETDDGEPLTFDTNIGLVRNLTIRQTRIRTGTDKSIDVAVWIKQGRLELEDCDISSTDGACIVVSNDSDPRVRRNKIHSGRKTGLLISGRSRGTYEDNEVFSNGLSGIAIAKTARPTLRRNRCFGNRRAGIFSYDKAEGVYEDNELFDNSTSGIQINESSSPILRRNRIYANQASGVSFNGDSRGTCEDSDIFSNGHAGITVSDKAMPIVRRNKVNTNSFEGIWIRNEAGGSFFDNDLTANEMGSWDVKDADMEKISKGRNAES